MSAEKSKMKLGSVEPFTVDLSKNVPRMLDLVNNTKLPETSIYSDLGSSAGIDPNVLRELQKQWITDFDWDSEEEQMNGYAPNMKLSLSDHGTSHTVETAVTIISPRMLKD